MKRLHVLPASLAGRTILLLVVGLVLSHLASYLVYYNERGDLVSLMAGRQLAERIAAITEVVDDTPTAGRAKLLTAFSTRGLHVRWDAAPVLAETPEGDDAFVVVEALESRLGMADGRIRVRIGEQVFSPAHPSHGTSGQPMHAARMDGMRVRVLAVSLQLEDDTWLSFETPMDRPAERLGPWGTPRYLLSEVLTALMLLGLAVWMVRRMTAPLDQFARAAERLGRDVNAPPMPDTGPREVRQAVGAFNRMQERLRRFIAARTGMLAAISHDLRTPLTRLRLRVEFMEDEEQQAKVQADLDEMEAMIAATLAFARDEASDEDVPESIDLKAFLAKLCADMAEGGGSVFLAAPAGPIPCLCRPGSLRRALTNFVDNALKYGERARISLIVEPERVTITIDDYGPGIPESEQESVFTPFYRLEASRNRDSGGVGLGLAVARGIIHAHGGEVALANRPDGGLRVSVTLPR